jgi:predicted nucleotidyltransferase
MDSALQNEIGSVVQTIADTNLISKIILFGSLARGNYSADSDVDLCALTDIPDRRPLDITLELREKLFGISRRPMDLLTYRTHDFEERSRRRTTFEYGIKQEGVVVYDRTGTS